MPYFTGMPTAPLPGIVSLPMVHPPIVGTPVNLGNPGFFGDTFEKAKGWVGLPDTGSVGKAAGYGIFGLGMWVGGAYLPTPHWSLKLGKGILFVAGGWILYRSIMQISSLFKNAGIGGPGTKRPNEAPALVQKSMMDKMAMYRKAGYIDYKAYHFFYEMYSNEQDLRSREYHSWDVYEQAKATANELIKAFLFSPALSAAEMLTGADILPEAFKTGQPPLKYLSDVTFKELESFLLNDLPNLLQIPAYDETRPDPRTLE